MQVGYRRCGFKKLGVSHAKLREVLHQDFADCSPLVTVIGSPVGLVPTNDLILMEPLTCLAGLGN
jgi:hypothetical protein